MKNWEALMTNDELINVNFIIEKIVEKGGLKPTVNEFFDLIDRLVAREGIKI